MIFALSRSVLLLHDLFFQEKFEYPTFAWQEAIINAIAHRDYSITGIQVEFWMFDDHLEVRSPGPPPEPVTIEQLAACRRERTLFTQSYHHQGAYRFGFYPGTWGRYSKDV